MELEGLMHARFTWVHPSFYVSIFFHILLTSFVSYFIGSTKQKFHLILQISCSLGVPPPPPPSPSKSETFHATSLA